MLLQIVILVVIAAFVGSFLLRGRRVSERQTITNQRVEAYMQTIRRERRNPELAAMSDTELRDLLLSSAHNLRVDAERRTWILIGAGGAAVVAAVVVATQDGWQSFGVILGIAAVAIYGLGQYLSRRMIAPLQQRGIDIERLRVE